MSTSIKFPEEHYCGMITSRYAETGKDALPLAFITPQGSDKAAEKRRDTVDRWVSSNTNRDKTAPPSVVLKNEAMGGFRLLDDVKRYGGWGGSGNVVWRVEDPRGFELEISSPNLMQILACTVVDCGEILDMCIWAREGAHNVLVPVTSETYQTATQNTERMAKSASLKDLNPGDGVVMQNGTTGRYIGRYHSVDWKYEDGDIYHRNPVPHASAKKKWVIIDTSGKKPVVHALSSSPKIAEIIPGEAITPEAGLVMINKLDLGYSALAYSLNANLTLVNEKIEVPLPTTPSHWNARYNNVICEYMDEYWIVSVKYSHVAKTSSEYELIQIDKEKWEKNCDMEFKVKSRLNSWGYGHSEQHVAMEVSQSSVSGPGWKRKRSIVLDNGKVVSLKD